MSPSLRDNIRLAKSRWQSVIGKLGFQQLKALTEQYEFSIADGDLVWLERGWYVTHTGLVRLARRYRCAGIHAKPIPEFCNAQAQQWAFEAIVYKSKSCRGFVGYGDADPSNVSTVVAGAEMRVAETRAVNRALRKAYGIGICSVDEIGSVAEFRSLPRNPRNCLPNRLMETVAARSGIVCIRLFVSINSIRTWSSLTRLISAPSKHFATPRANRSRISWRTYPIGLRKTVMPSSASSTVISARRKVPHETQHRGLAGRGHL
jgi:hypothetical protein